MPAAYNTILGYFSADPQIKFKINFININITASTRLMVCVCKCERECVYMSVCVCVCMYVCVYAFRIYSKSTSVTYLQHIQSMSYTKLERTNLRFTLLADLKHWRPTKWRLPIITSFNCCVAIEMKSCKNVPTVSHSGILRMHNFWDVVQCHSLIHYRIFEGTRNFPTAGSH